MRISSHPPRFSGNSAVFGASSPDRITGMGEGDIRSVLQQLLDVLQQLLSVLTNKLGDVRDSGSGFGGGGGGGGGGCGGGGSPGIGGPTPGGGSYPSPGNLVGNQLTLGNTTINLSGSGAEEIAQKMKELYSKSPGFKAAIDSKAGEGINVKCSDLGGNTAGLATLGGNEITYDQPGVGYNVIAHEVGHMIGMNHGQELDSFVLNIGRESGLYSEL